MHLILGLARMKIVMNVIGSKDEMRVNYTAQYIAEGLKQ